MKDLRAYLKLAAGRQEVEYGKHIEEARRYD